MSKNSSSSNGASTLGMLGVGFVILKLTGVIDWSWWYITLPFWGGIVLLIVGLLIWLLVKVIKNYFANKKLNKKIAMNSESKVKYKSKFQARLEEMADKRNN